MDGVREKNGPRSAELSPSEPSLSPSLPFPSHLYSFSLFPLQSSQLVLSPSLLLPPSLFFPLSLTPLSFPPSLLFPLSLTPLSLPPLQCLCRPIPAPFNLPPSSPRPRDFSLPFFQLSQPLQHPQRSPSPYETRLTKFFLHHRVQ